MWTFHSPGTPSELSDHEQFDLLSIDQIVDIPRRRCIQLQNLLHHCNYTSFEIDPKRENFSGVDMVIATIDIEPERLAAMAEKATQSGTTLCIMSPAYDAPRHNACEALVAQHRCTSIDNRGYLLLFNNYLPKQIFKL